MAQRTTDPEISQRVDEIMSKMSLTDKVGQMTQYAIDMLSVGEPYKLEEPHRLDPDKLEKYLVEQRVGSILNVGGHGYTREHWHDIIGTIQEMAIETNGIPVVYGIDAIHGTNYTLGATLFPQQIGLAATWNPLLVEQLAEVTAYETRASGIPWNFTPVLDLGRDPRWPRFWEGFGEDPHLATVMGLALNKGYQGDDIGDKFRIASCLKHYMGYSVPNTGKDRTQAWIPERQLREYFMPMFEAAIDAGAASIMVNSSEINGIPAHASKFLLTELLRDEMGFQGVAVSDWEDVGYLYTRHKIAVDYKDAIRQAINAGIDMAMVPNDERFPVLLKELVEEGEIPMSRIDEAVRRILTMKVKLGLFEEPICNPDDYPDFNSQRHVILAYQGAAESITLLKNKESILPLSIGKKILVTGPTANSLNYLNGGWTWTWQGDDPRYHPEEKQTIVESLREKYGESSIEYVQGCRIDAAIDIDAAVKAAGNVDVIVACLGEANYTEKPGDINNIAIDPVQVELIHALKETGKPIVLVLVQGRPRVIRQIAGDVDAIVYCYLPGPEGGPALADILSGAINPSGKLPFTYPGDVNDIVPYDHRWTDVQDPQFSTESFRPQFEFGHGLSYTTFKYSDLAIDRTKVEMGGTFNVSVAVTNTGNRAGKEVVQLFSTDKVASITPSVKRLRAFEKVSLDSGESRTLTFTLSTRDLAFVGRKNKWVTEPGEFSVTVGGLTVDFEVE